MRDLINSFRRKAIRVIIRNSSLPTPHSQLLAPSLKPDLHHHHGRHKDECDRIGKNDRP